MPNRNEQSTLAPIDERTLTMIHGGGVGGLLVKGFRAARPYVKDAADLVKDLGIIAAGAVGAVTSYDYWFGGKDKASPDTSSASTTPHRPFGH